MTKKPTKQFYQGLGRRKRSTATVQLIEGKGDLLVNGVVQEEHFKGALCATLLAAPFSLTGNVGKFYGTVKVSGGGRSGQLGAVCLALARALLAFDAENRGVLRLKGLLTRDSREVERKKYNLHGARRAHQFSKR